MLLKAVFSLIFAFILTLLVMPLVIMLSKKLKLRQTILHYVDNHSSKSGTPTMGGTGFVVVATVTSFIFMIKGHSLMMLTVFVMLGYAVIGFLDDFIKVFFKQNKGLSALQKIIFQLLIALIVSIYAYYNSFISDVLFLPFTLTEVSIGFFSIPLYVFIFVALTNSVNLTDGLDGLASKVSIAYILSFATVIFLAYYFFFEGQAVGNEYINLIIFCASLAGALIGFVCFNGFPAKIFMGDTGALGIGGALACLAVVSKLTLLVPIIGIMFVLTSISDIIQVLYYKRTKKRIFLMAPLHHHFERKGVHENRIVTFYTIVTALIGIVTVGITLYLNS